MARLKRPERSYDLKPGGLVRKGEKDVAPAAPFLGSGTVGMNMIPYSEPTLAQVPTKHPGVTEADFADYGLGKGVRFNAKTGNSQYAYFNAVFATTGVHTLICDVVMDDGGAPVAASAINSGVDLRFQQASGSRIASSYQVVHLGGGRYRVSGVFASVQAGTFNVGVIRDDALSTRQFRVTRFQLVTGTSDTGETYAKTTGTAFADTRTPLASTFARAVPAFWEHQTRENRARNSRFKLGTDTGVPSYWSAQGQASGSRSFQKISGYGCRMAFVSDGLANSSSRQEFLTQTANGSLKPGSPVTISFDFGEVQALDANSSFTIQVVWRNGSSGSLGGGDIGTLNALPASGTSLVATTTAPNDATLSHCTVYLLVGGTTTFELLGVQVEYASSLGAFAETADYPVVRYQVDPNVPRTRQTKGGRTITRLEPPRTNLVLHSKDINQSGWFKAGTYTVTGSPGNQIFRTTDGTGRVSWLQAGVVAGEVYTFSWKGALLSGNARYSIANQTNSTDIVSVTAWPAADAQGWRSVTITVPSGCTSITFYPQRTPGGDSSVLLEATQLEKASYRSSYIETNGSAVERKETLSLPAAIGDAKDRTWLVAYRGKTVSGVLLYRTTQIEGIATWNSRDNAGVSGQRLHAYSQNGAGAVSSVGVPGSTPTYNQNLWWSAGMVLASTGLEVYQDGAVVYKDAAARPTASANPIAVLADALGANANDGEVILEEVPRKLTADEVAAWWENVRQDLIDSGELVETPLNHLIKPRDWNPNGTTAFPLDLASESKRVSATFGRSTTADGGKPGPILIDLAYGTDTTAYDAHASGPYDFDATLVRSGIAYLHYAGTTYSYTTDILRRWATGGTAESPVVLIEGARTNLLVDSQAFTVTNWGDSKGYLTREQDVVSGPFGGLADRVTNNFGVFYYMFQNVGISGASAGRTFTFSCWARNTGTANGTFGMVESGGAAGAAGMTNVLNESSIVPGGGWARYRITSTVVGNDRTTIQPRINFNDGAVIELWGAQLEEARFASSYIPTTGSSVARNTENYRFVTPMIDPYGDFTIAVAVRPNGWDETDTVSHRVLKGFTSSYAVAFEFFKWGGSANHSMGFKVFDADGGSYICEAIGDYLTKDSWHTFFAVKNGNNMRLYINGVLRPNVTLAAIPAAGKTLRPIERLFVGGDDGAAYAWIAPGAPRVSYTPAAGASSGKTFHNIPLISDRVLDADEIAAAHTAWMAKLPSSLPVI